jgi:hypothetical protein
MKVAVARADRHRSLDGVRRFAQSTPEVADAIDTRENSYRVSVRLWLATHSVAPSKEEAFTRSIASSLRELAPIRGRWAFLTRAEKSCISWARESHALIRNRIRSGH